MIGEKIVCLKNVGPVQLKDADSKCGSLNSHQVLPRTKQESDDLVPALLSLGLASKDENTLVSIGIHRTKDGGWHDYTDQLITYFNWLPNEPDLIGDRNHTGLWIDRASGAAGWADYSGTEELNVVCMKCQNKGKNITCYIRLKNCEVSW